MSARWISAPSWQQPKYCRWDFNNQTIYQCLQKHWQRMKEWAKMKVTIPTLEKVLLNSVFGALCDRKWLELVSHHCLYLYVSRAQMSLMMFTQGDIWSNQKTHDKHSTSCQSTRSERQKAIVTDAEQYERDRQHKLRRWKCACYKGSGAKERHRQFF